MNNTAKYTAIAFIAMLVGVWSAGCNDNPGPAGAPGAQGEQGAPGAAAKPEVSEKSSESTTTTKTASNAPGSGSSTITEKSTTEKKN
jgi:hypothetical protein